VFFFLAYISFTSFLYILITLEVEISFYKINLLYCKANFCPCAIFPYFFSLFAYSFFYLYTFSCVSHSLYQSDIEIKSVGLSGLVFFLISKCRCGIWAFPVIPTLPITCPFFTNSPSFTKFILL